MPKNSAAWRQSSLLNWLEGTIMSNGTAQVIAKVSQTVQVWYWPTLPQPYRVQVRLSRPGQPYRLHSAHDTQAEAEAEAARVAAPLREWFDACVAEDAAKCAA